MRDGGLVGTGIIFGWLLSKSWSDPECRLGLVIFLVATAVMFLVLPWPSWATGKNRRVPTAMKMTIASSEKETADALVGFALGREACT